MPFSELIGQNQAARLLNQAVAQDRIAPAYLFAGPPGVGRALAAKCFIELLFSGGGTKKQDPQKLQRRLEQRNHPDLLWVEPTYLHQGKLLTPKEAAETGLKRKAPPQIRLEQVRDVGRFLGRPPLEAARSAVVLERAETMGEGAANGLLKTLEEPGVRATLILIAPGVDSLLPTLVSRCQRIPFYRLNGENMRRILEKAGCPEILTSAEAIAMAQGSPGEAIACWQQLQEIPAEILQRATEKINSLREGLELAREISKSLDTQGQLWLIDYLQHNLWQRQHQLGVYRRHYLESLEKARRYLLAYVQPRLVWECTLMGMCEGR
ncbi:MAG: DNA polymerase III subunit delta' [Okeania sp. SIO2H7]|nr:DNA polymerase III subunit delta' [Okeania sp. SIO2H7]